MLKDVYVLYKRYACFSLLNCTKLFLQRHRTLFVSEPTIKRYG